MMQSAASGVCIGGILATETAGAHVKEVLAGLLQVLRRDALQHLRHPGRRGKGTGRAPPQEHLIHLLQRFPPVPVHMDASVSTDACMPG